MNVDFGHRKRVKHCDDLPCLHELTFSCYRRLPLLVDDGRCQLLAESVDRAMGSQDWQLAGYIFMPEQVHLLVLPKPAARPVARLLAAIKRLCSWRVKQVLVAAGAPLLKALTIRERPGKTVFRFWQEGGGYDRNLWSREALQSSLECLHANPVRRGLCPGLAEWWWSSWHHYHEGDGPLVPRVSGLPEDLWGPGVTASNTGGQAASGTRRAQGQGNHLPGSNR